MPISNLLDITEKGAPRILELWQESVLLQLKANTPKLTGTLAKALFVKHPIVKTGKGFVTGLGDKKMIGVDPFESPPANTISRFLDWWRDTPEGIREAKERQQLRDDRATKSARSEIERITARAERDAESAFVRQYDTAMKGIDRRIGRLEREIEGTMGGAFGTRGVVYRLEAWQKKLGAIEAEIAGIKAESAALRARRDKLQESLGRLQAGIPGTETVRTVTTFYKTPGGKKADVVQKFTEKTPPGVIAAHMAKIASVKSQLGALGSNTARGKRLATLGRSRKTAIARIDKYQPIVAAAKARQIRLEKRIDRLFKYQSRREESYKLYWKKKRNR